MDGLCNRVSHVSCDNNICIYMHIYLNISSYNTYWISLSFILYPFECVIIFIQINNAVFVIIGKAAPVQGLDVRQSLLCWGDDLTSAFLVCDHIIIKNPRMII